MIEPAGFDDLPAGVRRAIRVALEIREELRHARELAPQSPPSTPRPDHAPAAAILPSRRSRPGSSVSGSRVRVGTKSR